MSQVSNVLSHQQSHSPLIFLPPCSRRDLNQPIEIDKLKKTTWNWKEKMRVGKPGWAHWLIWAWVPREWALTFGVPQGWIPICAMNQCRAPEFCLAIEAPVLLGSCSFSFFFFPLHWTISKSYLDSLSWNKKTNNHQTQWKWGKCPQWAAWPELDVKARPEAEES